MALWHRTAPSTARPAEAARSGLLAAVFAWSMLSASLAAQEIAVPVGAAPGAALGSAVAMAGDWLFVSAPGGGDLGPGTSRVHALRHVDGEWRLETTFDDRTGIGDLGRTLAGDGPGLAAGQMSYSSPLPGTGAVWVFDARTPGARSILRFPDPPRISTAFGGAIARAGDVLVVGAAGAHVDGVRTGAAYVFRRIGADWTFEQRLTPPVPTFESFFGLPRMSAGRILVAAPREVVDGRVVGAVHTFAAESETPDAPWVRRERLLSPFPESESFGRSLATFGNEVVVLLSERGRPALDVFELVEGVYEHRQRLVLPLAPALSNSFALALGASGLAVGVQLDSMLAARSGAVYVFRRAARPGAGPFELAAYLSSPQRGEGDRFGAAVAMASGRLVVGSPGALDGAGAAYSYDLREVVEERLGLLAPLGTTEISGLRVRALTQDAQGLLWLGSETGLVSWDGAESRLYAHDPVDPNSLPEGLVLALLRDSRDRLWVGTERGLARFEPTAESFVRYEVPRDPAYPRTSFVALFEDRAGTIWTGTNGRVYRLDEVEDRLTEYAPFTGPPESFDEPYVSGIQQSADGSIWVLCKNLWENRGALYRVSVDGSVIRYPLAPEWRQVGPFMIDSRDRFWIKAPVPARIPDAAGAPVEASGAPLEDAHWAWHEDASGAVWAGLDHGYYRVPAVGEGGRGEVVRGALRARGVLSFTEVRDGSFLVGSASGVVRETDLAALWRERRPDGTIVATGAGERNGAAAAGMPAAVILREAEIADRAGIRRLRGDDVERLLILPDDFNFTLRYAAPIFVDPASTRFRYRMANYDRDWIDAGDRRLALYTNVPPGEYVFEVQADVVAANGERVPALPLSVPVVVVAPFWQRWWFRGLVGLALAAVVLSLVQVRRNHREQLLQVRRQIASDLHDDLSTNLSGITMVTRLLARDTDLGARDRERLQRIVETSDSMAADLRDIVWLVDPGRDTAVDVVAKMRAVAADLLGAVDHRLTIDGASLARFDMARRRQVLLVYKELLHNVVRHAQAERVDVTLDGHGGDLRLVVEDDGVGFDPESPRTGHGLHNLHVRARRLGGEVQIRSAPGRGTRVEVLFSPRARA